MHGLQEGLLPTGLASERPTSTPLLNPPRASLQAEYTESTGLFGQNQRKERWRSDMKGGPFPPHRKNTGKVERHSLGRKLGTLCLGIVPPA